jgi:hypothetical protein
MSIVEKIVPVIINHLRLPLIIFSLFFILVIFATTLQLICNYFGFHARRTIYVPLIANVTNLIYKGVFSVFSKI